MSTRAPASAGQRPPRLQRRPFAGDLSPGGHLGKTITAVAIFCGVILLAMPLAIVGNNFSMAWEERAKMRFVVQVRVGCADPTGSVGVTPSSIVACYDAVRHAGSPSSRR